MEDNDHATERRTFLMGVSAAAVALMGGAASFIGAGFLYPVKRKQPSPRFVCLESEVPEGEPLEINDPLGRKVLLFKKAGGKLLAIGTVCSHLGCAVFYRSKKKMFDCPCHQGVFDGEGNPVSGPPERPLDRYPVTVSEGKVFVQFS